MKLLLITYSYSPDLTPRAFRWSKVVAHLAAQGHQIHVLCSGKPRYSEQIDNGAGISVFRVEDWLQAVSSRVKTSMVKATPGKIVRQRFSIRDLLSNVVRSIWRAVYWPDYSWGWLIPAVRMVRRMCLENEYDWIISVSHPFSGHLVGFAAKEKSPKSSWLVDIGDPYSDAKEPPPNNFLFYSYLNRSMEGRILSAANLVSVTTLETQRLYEASFPSVLNKICVIPPLLSLPKPSETNLEKQEGVVKLVYVGTLYKSLRSPKFLLKYLHAVGKLISDIRIELHFYGAINDCQNEFQAIPEMPNCKVLIHGMVARQDVVNAMAGADILINIGNNSREQLATKVIEYMAMAKPILNIVSIEGDASIEALIGYPYTKTVFQVAGEIPKNLLMDILNFIISPPKVDSVLAERVCLRYSTDSVSDAYASSMGLINQR